MVAKPRILIVEREVENKRALFNICLDSDLEAYMTSSWSKAQVLLKKRYYDVIILGDDETDVTGLEMIRAVRALGLDSCILISSSFTETRNIVSCLKEGAYDIIPKPIDMEWAKIKIKRALERRIYYTNAKEKEHYLILSIFDELTRVHNHRFFHDSLKKEISSSKRYRHPLSILMMDLDDFKSYNDSVGHLRGDEALRHLGSILPPVVREGDTVCRYGGDEFAVILPHTDKEGAVALAERLRSVVEESVFAHEHRIPRGKLTISIGVATFPEDAAGKDELINKADIALYKAKGAGGNSICTS